MKNVPFYEEVKEFVANLNLHLKREVWNMISRRNMLILVVSLLHKSVSKLMVFGTLLLTMISSLICLKAEMMISGLWITQLQLNPGLFMDLKRVGLIPKMLDIAVERKLQHKRALGLYMSVNVGISNF